MRPYTPLYLVAENHSDITFLASCLQDALVPLAGLKYEKEEETFHLIANRFCWECEAETGEELPLYSRVVAGLSFHNVKEVSHRGLDLQTQNELLNLLTIIVSEEEGCVYLIFSGGLEIKLKIDNFVCHLKDIDTPYPTPNKPIHT